MRHIARPEWLSANGTDPLLATGRPVRWGVISTGNIADKVTAQLRQLQDVELVAVSSRSAERAKEFAAKHGFVRWHGDDDGEGGERTGYERLAEDPEVEVVYVATPHGQHHEVASALLRSGKHVLVEKAFTINAREARELSGLAKEHGRFLMEAMWTRFLPAFQYALDVLESGEIGEVGYVQAELGFMALGDPRSRLWAKEAGGGALLDLAVYPLTWIVGSLGYPETVHAAGRLNAEGVDELEALTLSYPDGRQAQLLTSLVTAPSSRALIVGSHGTIATEGSLTRPSGIAVSAGTSSPVAAARPATSGASAGISGDATSVEPFTIVAPLYAYQLREVTRSVQQGLTESPTMPLADSVRTMDLLDEARRQMGVTYPNDERP